jgi:hypothetical protein
MAIDKRTFGNAKKDVVLFEALRFECHPVINLGYEN